jgi:hypothetical protein
MSLPEIYRRNDMSTGQRSIVAMLAVACALLARTACGQCELPREDGGYFYGEHVAASAETAMIGSDHGAGVFRFNGATWESAQWLLPPQDCTSNCRFGRFLSMDEELAIIGAPDDQVSPTSRGSAYVFRWDGVAWQREQKLVAGENADRFGWSVDIDSNTAVVGAVNTDKVYVFRHDGKTWVHEQTFVGDEPAVAVSDNTLLIGEHQWGEPNYRGRVRVYEFDGQSWVHVQDLEGEGFELETFGHSVSISEDVVVVGRNRNTADAVHVFRYDGSSWRPEQILRAPADSFGFGNAVAVDQGTIVVGDRGFQQPPGEGAIHVYRHDGEQWVEQEVLVSPGPVDFGRSVAICASTLVVGAGQAAFVFGPANLAIDCNENGNADDCDIANGTSDDRNGNEVPDECEPCLLADLNGNEVVEFGDLLILLGFWGSCPEECTADLDLDGEVGFADLLLLLTVWGACE